MHTFYGHLSFHINRIWLYYYYFFFTLVRFYLETHKTVNTDQKYLWNVIVLQEINQLCEITKPQTAMVISLCF